MPAELEGTEQAQSEMLHLQRARRSLCYHQMDICTVPLLLTLLKQSDGYCLKAGYCLISKKVHSVLQSPESALSSASHSMDIMYNNIIAVQANLRVSE